MKTIIESLTWKNYLIAFAILIIILVLHYFMIIDKFKLLSIIIFSALVIGMLYMGLVSLKGIKKIRGK